MSQQQEPTVREKLIEKAISLGQQIEDIKTSEMPPHVKEKLIAGINSELEKLAKAINSMLRK